MNEALNNRAACLEQLRHLVGEDVWRARYALLSALQKLDLLGVNQVLDELESATQGVQLGRKPVLQKLLEERWG
jgi:hypothetical protein